jgi:5'-3' exonuclease
LSKSIGKADRDATKRVLAKFGIGPLHIPDYLALVGDTADRYPGIPRIGPKTAAALIARHGAIDQFPSHVLGEHRKQALLFKRLATLRTDAPLFDDVESLRWRGATAGFAHLAERLGAPGLVTRVAELTRRTGSVSPASS